MLRHIKYFDTSIQYDDYKFCDLEDWDDADEYNAEFVTPHLAYINNPHSLKLFNKISVNIDNISNHDIQVINTETGEVLTNKDMASQYDYYLDEGKTYQILPILQEGDNEIAVNQNFFFTASKNHYISILENDLFGVELVVYKSHIISEYSAIYETEFETFYITLDIVDHINNNGCDIINNAFLNYAITNNFDYCLSFSKNQFMINNQLMTNIIINYKNIHTNEEYVGESPKDPYNINILTYNDVPSDIYTYQVNSTFKLNLPTMFNNETNNLVWRKYLNEPDAYAILYEIHTGIYLSI